MTLQTFVVPDLVCDDSKLYFQAEGKVEFSHSQIKIASGSKLDTYTYMNLFDVDFWREKTEIKKLTLKIEVEGVCYVNLMCNGDTLATESILDGTRQTICFDIDEEYVNEGFENYLYFEIEAEEETILYGAEYVTDDIKKRDIKIGVIICTYKRQMEIQRNLEKLRNSLFFDRQNFLYGKMYIKVVDNASEIKVSENEFTKIYYNPNTGGSGGFKRGMQEFRNDNCGVTDIVLMDDDVEFIMETFYRLYALLSYIKDDYRHEVIAGRMFREDNRTVQYTAAEIWNGGDIRHIGENLDMTRKESFNDLNDSGKAEYSGWWFASYPMDFVWNNDPLPFFLHCDDVEYGLRHGGTPIILNGIQVWHETYEYRQNPVIAYYDTRNPLIVNEIYGLVQNKEQVLRMIEERINYYRENDDLKMEYMTILGLYHYCLNDKRFYGDSELQKCEEWRLVENIDENLCEKLYEISRNLYLRKYVYKKGKNMKKKTDANKNKISIYVSMHKESFVPENKFLKPIQVGASFAERRFGGMFHDDEGENISDKNKRYCEMTAQYWAWKNDKESDYYGFWHYRRYFAFNEKLEVDQWANIKIDRLDDESMKQLYIDEKHMEETISKYDVIVPVEWTCNEDSVEMTISEHWRKHFYDEDLKLLIKIVEDKFSKYKESLVDVLFSTKAPFCNLFIMKKEYFEEYNQFCFGVLEEIEKHLDHKDYNVEEYRTLGHIGERLVAVYLNYLEKNCPNVKILRLPTVLISDTKPMAKVYPIKKDNVVALALACNDEFIPITAVLLESIKQNSSKNIFYDITIMHRSISLKNQKTLNEQFSGLFNFSLRFVDVSRNFEKYENVHVDRHLSVETYFRFMILDIFSEYSKILYLDCDMVVNTDIAELYNTDIGNKAIGAVRDLDFAAAYRKEDVKKLYDEKIMKYVGFENASDYFQAGTILFNIDKIAKMYKTEDLFDVATSRSWYYHDQDVLNKLFNGEVYYLDLKWNVYTLLEEGSDRENLIYKFLSASLVDEYVQARKDLGIIHFAGVPKPWKDKSCDLSQYFWCYARTSLFYEEICKMLNYYDNLPYGSVFFVENNSWNNMCGIDVFDIELPPLTWTSNYITVEFMFLANHFQNEYCRSTLYIETSNQTDGNGDHLIVKRFEFEDTDFDYLLKDNVGYKVINNNIIRLFVRQSAQYTGVAWKVKELQSTSVQKPHVSILNIGEIVNTIQLDNVIYDCRSKVDELNDIRNMTNVFNEKCNEIERFRVEFTELKNNVTAERDFFQYRVSEIEKSFTYKVGRFITFIPRKIRRKKL